MLYPIKFTPLLKERIWGGKDLEKYGKKITSAEPVGESWEISGVAGDISVVANGSLKGNNLQELIEIYMGDLVGDKVYQAFGEEFPLLIKLIDAQDNLSIQVHPDDELSKTRHNAYGKTEMWYVVDHNPGAELLLGFNQEVNKAKYIEFLEKGELDKLLCKVPVSKDDAFFIPAGTIHAIGSGMLIAEIQQTSDITYRVFDFNRTDANGNPRELHTELALDAIEYAVRNDYDVTKIPVDNKDVELVSCQYFTTNTLKVNGSAEFDLVERDSFTIYMCLEGNVTISTDKGDETLSKGESILIPAIVSTISFEGNAQLLETFIPEL